MGTTEFYILLFVHLSGLIVGLGSVLVTDLYGLLWVANRVRFPQLVDVSGHTEKFIWAGWGTMVAAGIPMILLKGVVDDLMIVKLFFVGLIGVNGIALHMLHNRIRGYREGEDVPNLIMFRLGLALLVSQMAWWGAVTIGFLHRHVQSFIYWPDTPWLVSGAILVGLLSIWAIGEMLLRATGKTVEA